jgi:hypothetical protein
MIKLKDLICEDINLSRKFTPEFLRWFGNSKVVDNHNNPMMVFHGTKSPVNKFSKKRKGFGSTMFGSYEVDRYGIFAAEDPELARWFMNQGYEGSGDSPEGSIMPLYMKIENPLDTTISKNYTDALFNTTESVADEMGYKGYTTARLLGDKWGRGHIWTLFDADEYNEPEIWIDLFKKLDYDGVKINERVDGEMKTDTWVAFDPEQVKSAYGNIGKFDPTDDDITKENYS